MWADGSLLWLLDPLGHAFENWRPHHLCTRGSGVLIQLLWYLTPSLWNHGSQVGFLYYNTILKGKHVNFAIASWQHVFLNQLTWKWKVCLLWCLCWEGVTVLGNFPPDISIRCAGGLLPASWIKWLSHLGTWQSQQSQATLDCVLKSRAVWHLRSSAKVRQSLACKDLEGLRLNSYSHGSHGRWLSCECHPEVALAHPRCKLHCYAFFAYASVFCLSRSSMPRAWFGMVLTMISGNGFYLTTVVTRCFALNLALHGVHG